VPLLGTRSPLHPQALSRFDSHRLPPTPLRKSLKHIQLRIRRFAFASLLAACGPLFPAITDTFRSLEVGVLLLRRLELAQVTNSPKRLPSSSGPSIAAASRRRDRVPRGRQGMGAEPLFAEGGPNVSRRTRVCLEGPVPRQSIAVGRRGKAGSRSIVRLLAVVHRDGAGCLTMRVGRAGLRQCQGLAVVRNHDPRRHCLLSAHRPDVLIGVVVDPLRTRDVG